MKKIILLMLVAIVSLGASAQKNKSKGPQKEKVTFNVTMDCQSCKAAIEKSIPFEKGVRDLEVDFDAGKVTITFDPSKTSKANLVKALNSLKDIKVTESKECCSEKKECPTEKIASCTEKKCDGKKACPTK